MAEKGSKTILHRQRLYFTESIKNILILKIINKAHRKHRHYEGDGYIH